MTIPDDQVRKMLAGCEGVPEGPWAAHMDDLTLHVSRGAFIPDNFTLALCATGGHAYRVTPYLAACDPTTIAALLTELLASREALAEAGEALRPFGRVTRNIPEGKDDKEVTRVVMDEILSAEDFAKFEARGAPLRSPHAERVLSLDGLRASDFRRASRALSTITNLGADDGTR